MTHRRVLHSWKEIANYMGLGVRTVQRYEAHSALPVRRPSGTTRSSVLAFSDEIDDWLTAAPKRNDGAAIKGAQSQEQAQTVAAQIIDLERQRRFRILVDRARESVRCAGAARDSAAKHSDEVRKLVERARAIKERYPFKHGSPP